MAIPEKFVVSLYDDMTGKGGQITLETERQSEETLSDIAARLIPIGARQFAGEIAGSDADPKEIDAIVSRLRTDGFGKDGEATPFYIHGIDLEGQPWTERVEAVDEEDAEFSARWNISIKEGAFPDGAGLERFLRNFDELEIWSCGSGPATFDEIFDEAPRRDEGPSL